MAMTDTLAPELEELIAALDRRVPRVEQAGEIAIARDAAALRARAVERLREIAADATADGGLQPSLLLDPSPLPVHPSSDE